MQFIMKPANGITDTESHVFANLIYKSMPEHVVAQYPDAADHKSLLDYVATQESEELVALDLYFTRMQEYCFLLACTKDVVFADEDDAFLKDWWAVAKQSETLVAAFDLFIQQPKHEFDHFMGLWREAEKDNRSPKDSIASRMKALRKKKTAKA